MRNAMKTYIFTLKSWQLSGRCVSYVFVTLYSNKSLRKYLSVSYEYKHPSEGRADLYRLATIYTESTDTSVC